MHKYLLFDYTLKRSPEGQNLLESVTTVKFNPKESDPKETE